MSRGRNRGARTKWALDERGVRRVRSMMANGATVSQMANSFGVSAATLADAMEPHGLATSLQRKLRPQRTDEASA